MRKTLSALALGLSLLLATQPVLAQTQPAQSAEAQNAAANPNEEKIKAVVTRMQATATKMQDIGEKMQAAAQANDKLSMCNLTKDMYPHFVELRDSLKELATYAPAGTNMDKMNGQIQEMDTQLKAMEEAVKAPCA